MTKNLTLTLDETILRRARQEAVAQELSLSQWVAELISDSLKKKNAFLLAKKRALKRLQKGFDLGGKPLSREDIYAR